MSNYQILRNEKIGKGANSEVYKCVSTYPQQRYYAMKITQKDPLKPSSAVMYEAKLLQYLKGAIGIPRFYSFSEDAQYSYLVTELLGKNLEDFFQDNRKKLNTNLFKNIALQMICRLEFLHSKGFVHGDVKPENFAFGANENSSIIYLLDYNLSSIYKNLKTNVHIPFNGNLFMKGTPTFASINSHLKFSLSRRDDIESLAYCLIYFWCGVLPWMKKNRLFGKDYLNQIMVMKIELNSEGKKYENLHRNLLKFLNYADDLKFEQEPDYKYLKTLIQEI